MPKTPTLKDLTGTNTEINVIVCDNGKVPAADYAIVPVAAGLDEAARRYRNWKHTKTMGMPEIVYQTKHYFYFPLEDAQ